MPRSRAKADARTITVVGIVAIGVIAELGAIGLYLRVLGALAHDQLEPAALAVLVGAIGGLATLAGSALGILAPSPLAKVATTTEPAPVKVENTEAEPVPTVQT